MERMNGNVFAGVVRAAVSDGLFEPLGLFSAAVLLFFSVGTAFFVPVHGVVLILSATAVTVAEAIMLARAKRTEKYPYGLKAAGITYIVFSLLSGAAAVDLAFGFTNKLPLEKYEEKISLGFMQNCRDAGFDRIEIVLAILGFCTFISAVYLICLSRKTVRNLIPAKSTAVCIILISAAVLFIVDAVFKTVEMPNAVYEFLKINYKGFNAIALTEAATEVLAAAELLLCFLRFAVINIKIRKMKNAFCE